MRPAGPIAVASFAVALAACGSDELGDPTDPVVEPLVCEKGPGYRDDSEPQRVDGLTAQLVDLDDQPVAGELVQVCGIDLCINGESDAEGRVGIAAMSDLIKPAFKYGSGVESARFAWLVPDQADVELGMVRTVRLPALETAVPLVAGERASSGGLELAIEEDAEIEIDVLSFRDGAEQGLRALLVPLEQAPAVVGEAPGLELLYAATPTDTRFCPPAELSVDNSEGWEPGTAVEVWLHGIDVTQEWAPYGGWARVSDAVVDEGGERIVTTEPGLPMLGVLGFKRR